MTPSHAQQALPPAATTAGLPSFEVATVKPTPTDQDERGGAYTYPGGKFVCKGCPLQYLVMLAYGLQQYQVEGGPAWAGKSGFEIEARPPAGSASSKALPASPKDPPNDEQRQMLQALLRDRFHLIVRHASTQGKVYRLTASAAPKLKSPANPHEFAWAGSVAGGAPGGDGLRGTNITMDQLAVRIGSWLQRPVLNETNLTGAFDFETRAGDSDEAVTTHDIEAGILSSLHALGLNLRSGQGPVDTLLIQHAEQPTPN